MEMLHTAEVMAIFDIFFAYFCQNLVAMARPLQSEMSPMDWSTTKTHVISNHILIILRRNVFICIYSNFSPKIELNGNWLRPLSGMH